MYFKFAEDLIGLTASPSLPRKIIISYEMGAVGLQWPLTVFWIIIDRKFWLKVARTGGSFGTY